jgi:hypothetical protein
MKFFYNKATLLFFFLPVVVFSTQAQNQKEYYNYSVSYYEYVDDIQMVMIFFGVADHQEAFRYSRLNIFVPKQKGRNNQSL